MVQPYTPLHSIYNWFWNFRGYKCLFLELVDENNCYNKTSLKEVATFEETKENIIEENPVLKSEIKSEREEMDLNEELSGFNTSDNEEDNSELYSEIKIEEFYMSD